MSWLIDNWIEVFGAITGLIYIYFSIKENILLWPVGIISSIIYIYVFFVSKFYADMSLQFYYLFISVYGWYLWTKRKTNNNNNNNNNNNENENIYIRKAPIKIYIYLAIITSLLFIGIGLLLDKATDSPLPYWDSLTTSLSIIATWMLAKKYIDQWIIWIIVDLISTILYIYKNLYPTAILFTVFTTMAFVGYIQWKKSIADAK